MKIISSDVTIIGAGLTGLTIAYFLRKQNLSVHILEARDRIGGRIFTKRNPPHGSQEMGATWLGKKHVALIKLLEELNVGKFEQLLGKTAIYEPISTSPPQLVTLPPNADPSFRIKNGSSTLIDTMASQLVNTTIHTKQVVNRIHRKDAVLSVETATHGFQSTFVISTLPPFLLSKTIDIHPALPPSFSTIAEQTHTWMGESIKVGLIYEKPFWRAPKLSGTIFSNVGPIPEMYDHSNHEDTNYGLKGFLNGSYFSVTKAERLELVLKQLEKYYGRQVRDFISYEETVWRNEPFTFLAYPEHVLPHQNNGHSIYQQAYLDGQFFVAGSETALYSPGYMDGAVQSAHFVTQQIEQQLST